MKTKEKILVTSIDLFNRSGVFSVTTNHIAKAMDISPGNLYFHYDNKEEIILELFNRMMKETYSIWKQQKKNEMKPLDFIDANFEVYWKYRFFHREMYSLRRKDSMLGKMWKTHMVKMMKLMNVQYRQWVKKGYMNELSNTKEMMYVYESLLAMATTYLQFFESTEKMPGRRSIERGKSHVARLLLPYARGEIKDSFEKFITSASF